jgi:hypothetical protein
MHRGQDVAAVAANVDNSQDEEDGQPPEFHSLQEAAAAYKLKARDLAIQEEQLEAFLLDHQTSPTDFYEHGTRAVENSFDYFVDKFAKADGPYTAFIKKMLLVAEPFNPMRARTVTVTWMAQRVMECRSFGLPEFCREKMLNGMEGELDEYYRHIQGVLDWDAVAGVGAYNKSLENPNKGELGRNLK